jgi:membrane protein
MTSVRILYRACEKWVENQDSRMGAALAYYTLFSIAPLLILAIHIAGMVFGEEAARGEVAAHLQETVGPDAARAIQSLLENASKPVFGTWAATIGLAVIVIGALGIFLHLRATLCNIWKLDPPFHSTILGIVLDYSLAILMVVITGLLLLGSLAMSTVVAILEETIDRNFPHLGVGWQYVEMAVSFVFLTIVFGTVYQVLSGNRLAWRHVWHGATSCSLLFTVGKTLLGWYFAYASPASMYGAAGSLVVFLIWVYYSSQILFFGAELLQARRTRKEWLKPATTSL